MKRAIVSLLAAATIGSAPSIGWTQSLQPFSPQIAAIQATIAAADGRGGYYDREYRQEETRYWAEIPAWMQQHAQGVRSQKSEVRILDVGCGYATLLALATRIYGGARGTCFDLIEYLRAPVRSAYGLNFQRGNVELDPLPQGPYDVIILTEIIEHFNFHPLPTLKKIHDVLAPGGALFLSTPDSASWGRLYDYHKQLQDFPPPPALAPGERRPQTKDGHFWMYNKGELAGVLKQAGFRIVKLDYSPGIRGRHFNAWAAK